MRNSWIIANKSVGNRSANTCYQCFTRSLIFIVPRFDFVQWFGKQNLTSNSSSIHFSFGKFNVELGRQTGKILWIGYIEKNIILDSGKSWLIYRLATSFMMMNRALTSKSATSTLSLRNLNRKNIHAVSIDSVENSEFGRHSDDVNRVFVRKLYSLMSMKWLSKIT